MPANSVIEPGHTFASVTDKISAIVLTQRTPRFWSGWFWTLFCWFWSCCLRPHAAVNHGRRGLGYQ